MERGANSDVVGGRRRLGTREVQHRRGIRRVAIIREQHLPSVQLHRLDRVKHTAPHRLDRVKHTAPHRPSQPFIPFVTYPALTVTSVQ